MKDQGSWRTKAGTSPVGVCPVTSEGMLFRAETAKMLGVPIIMHDYITGGFTSNTSLAWYLSVAVGPVISH